MPKGKLLIHWFWRFLGGGARGSKLWWKFGCGYLVNLNIIVKQLTSLCSHNYDFGVVTETFKTGALWSQLHL